MFHVNCSEQLDEYEYYTGIYRTGEYCTMDSKGDNGSKHFENDDYEQDQTQGEYKISDVDKWAYISDIERLLDSAE